MARYRKNSKAFQARWHRQMAAELLSIGKITQAEDRLQRAEIIEQQLVHNRMCKFCSRPLTTDNSIDAGYGPDCAEKIAV